MDADAPALSVLSERPELAARLNSVFEALRVGDLGFLTEEELVESAPSCEKVHVRVAARVAFAPYLRWETGRSVFPARDALCRATLAASEKMQARALCVPVNLGDVGSAVARLEAAAVKHGGALPQICAIDLREQHLRDEEMPLVEVLARELPACSTFTLRDNRFGGGPSFWSALGSLLAQPRVAKVDLTYNAAMHKTQQASIRALSNQAGFEKLVWIYPETAVETMLDWDAWIEGGKERGEAVRAFHRAHYKGKEGGAA